MYLLDDDADDEIIPPRPARKFDPEKTVVVDNFPIVELESSSQEETKAEESDYSGSTMTGKTKQQSTGLP